MSEVLKQLEQEQREIGMFGITVTEMKEDFENWYGKDASSDQKARMAMSLLSNTQERMVYSSPTEEDIRQALNQAKFWIAESLRK